MGTLSGLERFGFTSVKKKKKKKQHPLRSHEALMLENAPRDLSPHTLGKRISAPLRESQVRTQDQASPIISHVLATKGAACHRATPHCSGIVCVASTNSEAAGVSGGNVGAGGSQLLHSHL